MYFTNQISSSLELLIHITLEMYTLHKLMIMMTEAVIIVSITYRHSF